ncbi:MAG: hypothetical protein GY772_22535 [bacterium]|nr:hypothetical protein [bacterium]
MAEPLADAPRAGERDAEADRRAPQAADGVRPDQPPGEGEAPATAGVPFPVRRRGVVLEEPLREAIAARPSGTGSVLSAPTRRELGQCS